MTRTAKTAAILLVLAASVAAQPPAFKPGEIIASVACAKHPGQTYALYLPSQYQPDRPWPIVFVFDPLARGRVPLELMKDAAERYGYILAASNNSRNGPYKDELEAAQAVSQDIFARFPLDERRMYFAGFSGGARLASTLALYCKCAAGVFLSGAGFSPGVAPSADNKFPVFAAVGMLDFNYPELTELDGKLEAAGFAHFLRRFKGQHEWATAAVWQEAFAWSALQTIKDGRRPRDDRFIAAELARATERARALEQTGDWFFAWQNYRQLAAAFSGLADTSLFQEQAAVLEKDPRVLRQKRQESEDRPLQQRVTDRLLNTSSGPPAIRADQEEADAVPRTSTAQAIHDLLEDIRREKDPRRKRVLQRVQGGILVNFLESGEAALAENKFPEARKDFELAEAVRPELPWPHVALARCLALSGDSKGAIKALRKARLAGFDREQLHTLLQSDPSLAALQQQSDFQKLVVDAMGTEPGKP